MILFIQQYMLRTKLKVQLNAMELSVFLLHVHIRRLQTKASTHECRKEHAIGIVEIGQGGVGRISTYTVICCHWILTVGANHERSIDVIVLGGRPLGSESMATAENYLTRDDRAPIWGWMARHSGK